MPARAQGKEVQGLRLACWHTFTGACPCCHSAAGRAVADCDAMPISVQNTVAAQSSLSTSTPPALTAAFGASEFRAALGMFATGVTIVTACTPDGQWLGLTANSFNSVSLSPPLVLWSLAQNARSLAFFTSSTHYAINVLAADQKDLALRFASAGTDRFNGVAAREGLCGAPLIEGAAAHFECVNRSRYAEGDHVIFVGAVAHCAHRANASPLLFHDGQFYTEHPL